MTKFTYNGQEFEARDVHIGIDHRAADDHTIMTITQDVNVPEVVRLDIVPTAAKSCTPIRFNQAEYLQTAVVSWRAILRKHQPTTTEEKSRNDRPAASTKPCAPRRLVAASSCRRQA